MEPGLLLLDPPSISVDEKLNPFSLGGRQKEDLFKRVRLFNNVFRGRLFFQACLNLAMNLKSEKLENSTKFQKYHRYTAALPTREFSIRWVKNQTYRLHRVAHRFSPPTLHPHRLPFTDRYRNFAYDRDFVPTVGNFSFVLDDLSFQTRLNESIPIDSCPSPSIDN